MKMKFNFPSSVITANVDANTPIVKNPGNVITDVQVVQTNNVKQQRPKIKVEKNKDTKRKYTLHYLLVNQDQRVLNLTNPINKHGVALAEARRLTNLNNTVIYILPVKMVVAGGKFTAKLTMEPRAKMPEYALVTV
jgi:hypothetical protein